MRSPYSGILSRTFGMGMVFFFLLGTGSGISFEPDAVSAEETEATEAFHEREAESEPDLKAEEEEDDDIDLDDLFDPGQAKEMFRDTHGRISRTILTSARWVDSFFENERFEKEINKTRVRAKLSSFAEEGSGIDLGASASLKLVLPQFNDKISIEFSGDPKDESNIESSLHQDTLREEFKDTNQESFTAAIRYFLEATDKRNIDFSSGLRIRDLEPILYFGPRYREDFEYGSWTFRYTQRFRWYTDDGLQSKTRFDLERPLMDRFFYRSSLEGAWFEDEDGFFYSLNFSLWDPLSEVRGLEYEWNNYFQTRPYNRLEEANFRVRYRQRLLWDWLTLEVSPQISFPKGRDYDPTPGILFRLEFIFGYVPGVDL